MKEELTNPDSESDVEEDGLPMADDRKDTPEMMDLYCHKVIRGGTRATGHDTPHGHFRKKLDPIDRETLGRIDLSTFKAFVRAVRGHKKMLPWALQACHLLEGKFDLVDPPPDKEDIPIVRLSKDIKGDILEQLLEPDEMERKGRKTQRADVERGDKPNGLLRRTRNTRECKKAHCGLFLVPKKLDVWRLIFDARPANRMLKRLDGFRLFSLQQLLGTVRGISAKGKWWCRTFDFRHYFYQIRMHPNLWPYFRIGTDLVPLVLAMGFHSAPMVAQSITWASILWHESGDKPKYLARFPREEMPAFLTLVNDNKEEVGAIFVLLDNIMVISNDEEILDYWEQRINRNIEKLNIQVKEGDESQRVAIPARSEVHEESPTAVFAGVEFSQHGWRSHSADRAIAEPRNRRDVSRVCGALQWELRIREEKLIDHPDFLGLLQRVGVTTLRTPDGLKRCVPTPKDWNSSFLVTAAGKKEILKLTEMRASRSWFASPEPSPIMHEYNRCTDATTSSTAWISVDPATGKCVTLGAVDHSQDADHRDHADVDYYEVLAVLEMATEIRKRHPLEEKIRINVVMDSMITKNVIEKGHSKSPKLCKLLQALFKLNIAFECIWICSTGNAADTPSRKGMDCKLEDSRVSQTVNALRNFLASHPPS